MNAKNWITKKMWHLSIAALLCTLTPSLFAVTAQMKLTGAGGNVFAGVYVNPYVAEIDGVSTVVICNDFSASTWVGEMWTADVYGLADPGLSASKQATKYPADYLDRYYAAAYLGVMLLTAPNNLEAARISFAIWSIFENYALTWLTTHGAPVGSADYDAVINLRSSAYAATAGGATPNFAPSDVTIYSPVAGSATGCGGRPCPTNSPQEFMVVRTPEPSALAMLGLDLLALGSVVFLIFRGRKRSPLAC